jgi:hypothetical protein
MPEDWAVTGVPAQPGCGCWDAPGVRERLSLGHKPQARAPGPTLGPGPSPRAPSQGRARCQIPHTIGSFGPDRAAYGRPKLNPHHPLFAI